MPGQALPPLAAFIQAGQAFEGSQTVTSAGGLAANNEAWRVLVRLQGCDMERGTLCGSMEALNAPSNQSSVVTFWEGEIVDNRNFTFATKRWEASQETDLRHWSSFPAFLPLKDEVERNGGRNLDLRNLPHIFMRWKEKCFVNVSADCGLTIAGFYYVCCNRADGSITGFYFDPNSSPFQRLALQASCDGRAGFSFGTYSLQ